MDLNLFIYFLFKEWRSGIVIMVEIHEIVLIVMIDDIFIMVMRLSLCLYLWLCSIFIVTTTKNKEKEAIGKGNQFRSSKLMHTCDKSTHDEEVLV
jgi:hypothetical protein